MAAYKALESDEMKENDQPTKISHQMIEKMKKVISSHRAALDFDKGYLNKVITAEGYDFVAEVKLEKVGLVKAESKRGGKQRKRLPFGPTVRQGVFTSTWNELGKCVYT